MPDYRLLVNGTVRGVSAPAEMPLLWVLRDRLQLFGTKYGCGVGSCGACAVHLDGVAVRSCRTPVSTVGSRAVTTIEGLAPGAPHACQRAWLEEDVAQCGFCQPGMIMEAAALLRRNPRPTDDDINTAFGGHVCRCGTYDGMRRAIHRAAAEAGGDQ